MSMISGRNSENVSVFSKADKAVEPQPEGSCFNKITTYAKTKPLIFTIICVSIIVVIVIVIAVPVAVSKKDDSEESEDAPSLEDPSTCIMAETNCSLKEDSYTCPSYLNENYTCRNYYTEIDVHCNITCNTLAADCLLEKMNAFKTKYPSGYSWTDDNSYYKWNGRSSEVNIHAGYGCAGFAFMLSDACFGNYTASLVTATDSNVKYIRVGDVLRINSNTHSVIVMEVLDDYFVIAEGNYNKGVNYGRKLERSREGASIDFYYTRYPDAC